MIEKLKIKYQILKSPGFTILETIIAIGVISLAISGAFSAVQTGLFTSSIAKEETRAYYLADEAIELIRNKRDSNFLDNLTTGSGVSWVNGITGPCAIGSTCYADPYNNQLVACGAGWGSCPQLLQNSSTLLYGYQAGWTPTIYKREVQIEQPSATQIDISVLITWSHAGATHQFKTKTLLTNWF